jgi:hypothetical protein
MHKISVAAITKRGNTDVFLVGFMSLKIHTTEFYDVNIGII